MRIYLSFFQFLFLVALLAESSGQAAHELDYESSKDYTASLADKDKLRLAAHLIRDVLHSPAHKSKYRAAHHEKRLKEIVRGIDEIISPSPTSGSTPPRHRDNPDLAYYGKPNGDKSRAVVSLPKVFRKEKQALYVISPLIDQLQIVPMDFQGERLGDEDKAPSIAFIEQNERNIKALLRLNLQGFSFYIGLVNPEEDSGQNLAARGSQHAAGFKRIFPNRNYASLIKAVEEGTRSEMRPIALKLHPSEVAEIEEDLFYFFEAENLTNSITGKSHGDAAEEKEEERALKLTALREKYTNEVRNEMDRRFSWGTAKKTLFDEPEDAKMDVEEHMIRRSPRKNIAPDRVHRSHRAKHEKRRHEARQGNYALRSQSRRPSM